MATWLIVVLLIFLGLTTLKYLPRLLTIPKWTVVFFLPILYSVVYPGFYHQIYRQTIVLGAHRGTISRPMSEVRTIPGTLQCEDMHYYAPGNVIFAACEDSLLPRFRWFPPLAHLDGTSESTGSIHIIDPQTKLSTRLVFENFQGPFVTHGIEVLQDPDKSNAVYVFAVNHLADPEYYLGNKVPKARSQIEIFHYVLKSRTIRHLRSVYHPLLTTPNDIYAKSPLSFYVTNDHYYREGFMRQIEDLAYWARWSNVVHIQLDRLSANEEETGVNATVALTGVHNINGFGHGQSEEELILTSAIGGVMYRARINDDDHRSLTIEDEVLVDSTIDNPSYYEDPYKTPVNGASGYVLAGLRRAIDLPKTHADPTAKEGVMVWHVRPKRKGLTTEWEKRLIFEDDGSNIRSASAAVLVPIKPARDSDSTEAWLFVSGFIANGIIATKVQL